MRSLIKDVNSIFRDLDAAAGDIKAKGTCGEKAVLRICEEFYQKGGGILYHSYTYKVDPEQAGNIKKSDNGRLYLENLGSTTEIDVLLVTPFRIFPIEVKTYAVSGNTVIRLTDEGIEGCYKTDKSPVHQNEMHCRHLYSQIYRVLPEGKTEYIKPIVVFVDKCKLKDDRSTWQKQYIPVAILDNIYALIKTLNKPCEYRLDLDLVDNALNECCTGYEKLLPLKKL